MFGVKRPREDDPGSELDHQHKVHKIHKLQKRGPSWQPSLMPESSVDLDLDPDLDQTLRFRAPTLTPVDSDDEDSPSPKKSARQYIRMGMVTPSVESSCTSAGSSSTHGMKPLTALPGNAPWPNNNDNNISSIPHNFPDQPLSSDGAFSSTPIHNQRSTTQSFMEDVTYGKENASLVASARLPSPVSDHGMITDLTGQSDTEMAFHSQSPQYSPNPECTQSVRFLDPTSSQQSPQGNYDASTCNRTLTRKKPTLVMGYRADCDKCRRQVPGHYSHIIQ